MRTVTFEVTEPFNWKEISTEIEDYFLKNYGKELFVRIREYDTSHLTKRNEIMKCIHSVFFRRNASLGPAWPKTLLRARFS